MFNTSGTTLVNYNVLTTCESHKIQHVEHITLLRHPRLYNGEWEQVWRYPLLVLICTSLSLNVHGIIPLTIWKLLWTWVSPLSLLATSLPVIYVRPVRRIFARRGQLLWRGKIKGPPFIFAMITWKKILSCKCTLWVVHSTVSTSCVHVHVHTQVRV